MKGALVQRGIDTAEEWEGERGEVEVEVGVEVHEAQWRRAVMLSVVFSVVTHYNPLQRHPTVELGVEKKRLGLRLLEWGGHSYLSTSPTNSISS